MPCLSSARSGRLTCCIVSKRAAGAGGARPETEEHDAFAQGTARMTTYHSPYRRVFVDGRPEPHQVQRPSYYDFRKAVKARGMTYRVGDDRRTIEIFRNGEFIVAYSHRGNWPDALRWFTATFRSGH